MNADAPKMIDRANSYMTWKCNRQKKTITKRNGSCYTD